MKRSWLRIIAWVAALAVVGGASATAGAAESPLTCERLPELMRAYLKQHIRFHYLSDDIKNRTADTYLKRVDPSKALLTEADAQRVRGEVIALFSDLRDGSCGRLEGIHSDLTGRYQGMEEYVRSVVEDDGYAIDASARVVIDPEKRGFPATLEEQQALYRGLIDFQMANYVSAGTSLDEARERLVHRYELLSRRMEEQRQEDLYAVFLDAFASSLDPHSNYFSAESLEDFQIAMELSLEGIGVALASIDGYAVVERVIPGGATDRLKALKPKDKIIAVAQESGEFVDVIDMALRDVVRLIRGKRGTKVHLRVLRQDATTRNFTVTIVRDTIRLEEQAASLRWETRERNGEQLKLAVIELPSFYGDHDPKNRQSSDDMRRLLEEAKAGGADGVLVDLSHNGGGLLEDAVEIAGLFIRKGGVVAVKDAYAQTKVLKDPDSDVVYGGPVVVLTSRGSASASEIVAGAMQDYGRAVVVGDGQTFGKGTVQSVVRLPPGLGALKVTTALYFRPGGASTQRDGVSSDIVLPPLFTLEGIGEGSQGHALANERIDPFRGEAANHRSNGKRWHPVSAEVLEELARRSQARVSADEEFAELSVQLEKARANAGVVTVAEILEAQRAPGENAPESAGGSGDGNGDGKQAPPGDAAASDGDGADAGDEEARAPQYREAVDILADYVELTRT